MKLDNIKYMKLAISIAEKGIKKGQSPFGAVIVDKKSGEVISIAHNTVISSNDPTAHAEINAIRKAGKKLKSFKFDRLDIAIYSTCEPCPMCLSAIHWSGIKDVYFGANISDSKKLGFNEILISNSELKKLSHKSIHLKIHENILANDCIAMMKKWKKSGRLY